MATCTRQGCGQKFDPAQNALAECVFHPGKPVFHEGLKSWSCCKEKNKPVMEFDQFMKIEGCATGVHSLEKRAVAPAPQPKTEESSVGVNGMMPSSDEKKTDTSAPKPAHQTTRDVFQPMKPNEIKSQSSPPKPEPEDDPESIVPEGSKCKRLACGITWSGMGNCKRGKLDKDECTYHPGTPVFHEGSKGYTCCKRRVLDFDDFLKLGGCKKGSHLFTETASTADGNLGEEESVECRFDFYQTPTSVIVSIFAKKVDQDNSIIKFGTSGVDVDLKFLTNKRFRRSFHLFGSIDPDQSTYKILSTKCEMVLIKSDGRSWSNLEKGDSFVGTVTFGVGGRTGTVGAKQIVT
ncbi:hypothetical protein PCASD_00367 [Puccinia coronata f. sp. avenae]|uniref:CHORD domain-containing protein n=1 Tax=Puccinia coronata f. sp. avenae TaxID=200324 RepID=A0A2N5VNL9_9BASI|nr:hypothetical protein PCASD_00367 [Puccinia coronata f. sp. avenae]